MSARFLPTKYFLKLLINFSQYSYGHINTYKMEVLNRFCKATGYLTVPSSMRSKTT